MYLEHLKKHWITGLGIGFIFLGFLYFLAQAIEGGWLPPEIRLALGLVAGSSLLFAGYHAHAHGRSGLDETLAGIGAALCYATLSYASFLEQPLVPATTLLIGVLVLSTVVAFAAFAGDKRILASLSFAGGLFAPIVLRVPGELAFLLFLYAAIINVGALVLATLKGWNELKLVSFATTLLLYSVYFIVFRPVVMDEPFTYILVFFLIYFLGLLVGPLLTHREFTGTGLYLNFLNGGAFLFWTMYIMGRAELSYTPALLIVGALYVLASFLIGYYGRRSRVAVFAYFLVGLLVLAISTGDTRAFFETPGIQYCLNAALWGAIAFALYLRGQSVGLPAARYAGVIAWFVVLGYWFSHAWDVEWVRWFGARFIPFLNPGALVWIGLAVVGFVMARGFALAGENTSNVDPGDDHGGPVTHQSNEGLAVALALVSHGVLAGLFTIQLQNIWRAYDLGDDFFRLDLLLSTAYTLHALLIFLWGAHMRQTIFRRAGSVLLVFIALKVLFSDLSADPTMMKAVYLMIMGGITVAIGAINARWKEPEQPTAAPAETNGEPPIARPNEEKANFI